MSTITRSKKDRNNPYVMINKKALQNDKMSAKAKGIFAYLMSLPDDWKLYISELQCHFKDGRDGISAGIKELEAFGYITKKRVKNKNGRFDGWDYSITETPKTEKPYSEKPKTENPKLLNNDNTNNNNTNKKGDKSPGFNQIKELYFSLYQTRFGKKPLFDGSEGRAIKNILKNVSLNDFEILLTKYMHTKDDFYIKQGLSLKYFQTAIKGIMIQDQNKSLHDQVANNEVKYTNTLH